MLGTIQNSEKTMQGLSLILAPALLAVSSFFWKNGHYGITGGTLIVLDMLFWIPAFMALFAMVKYKTPRYAVWALPVAILGCIAGANFGFADFFTKAFNISHQAYLDTLADYPLASNLLLFQTGPLMPLSLIVLSLVLAGTKTVDVWVSVFICLGAIMFPVSRISRNEMLAHVCDVLLLVPLVYVGMKMLNNRAAKYTVAV